MWARRGEVLAVHAPGNAPGVHGLWPQALALGYRVAVRPSRREPLTCAPAHHCAAAGRLPLHRRGLPSDRPRGSRWRCALRRPRARLRRPGSRRPLRSRPIRVRQRAGPHQDPDHRRTRLAGLPRRRRRLDRRARRDGVCERHRRALRRRRGAAGTRDRRAPGGNDPATQHRPARRSCPPCRSRTPTPWPPTWHAEPQGTAGDPRRRPGGGRSRRRVRGAASRGAPAGHAGPQNARCRDAIPLRLGVTVVARGRHRCRCGTR